MVNTIWRDVMLLEERGNGRGIFSFPSVAFWARSWWNYPQTVRYHWFTSGSLICLPRDLHSLHVDTIVSGYNRGHRNWLVVDSSNKSRRRAQACPRLGMPFRMPLCAPSLDSPTSTWIFICFRKIIRLSILMIFSLDMVQEIPIAVSTDLKRAYNLNRCFIFNTPTTNDDFIEYFDGTTSSVKFGL